MLRNLTTWGFKLLVVLSAQEVTLSIFVTKPHNLRCGTPLGTCGREQLEYDRTNVLAKLS